MRAYDTHNVQRSVAMTTACALFAPAVGGDSPRTTAWISYIIRSARSPARSRFLSNRLSVSPPRVPFYYFFHHYSKRQRSDLAFVVKSIVTTSRPSRLFRAKTPIARRRPSSRQIDRGGFLVFSFFFLSKFRYFFFFGRRFLFSSDPYAASYVWSVKLRDAFADLERHCHRCFSGKIRSVRFS